MRLIILLLFTLFAASRTTAQELHVIDQNYDEALTIATQQDKLIFIDFYTTWCQPCKQLDKLVFTNDSIRQELAKDFVLLKYDAENDTIFHLSKKHHISSYPTGLILNTDGRVLTRRYGFAGNDLPTLAKSVQAFTDEGIAHDKDGEVLEGYSGEIDASIYPAFYVDFVNRTDTKIDSSEINEYFSAAEDIFSEEYFSTLVYFASRASDAIAETTLKNKDNYLAKYGTTDVEILLFSLTSGKFRRAIAEQNQEKYEQAVVFAKAGLSKKWTDDILPSFERDNLKAQNRWTEVLEIYEGMKAKGEFSNGYANHVSWQVYKKCDDREAIKKCLGWMKEVTDEEPIYDYLDTYAFLLHKSGNVEETERIARLAIEAAKKENRSTKNMEALLN